MLDTSLGPARVSNIEAYGGKRSVVEEAVGCKDVRSPSEDPPKNDIESYTSGNTHARNLQHSHGIALFRHPRESSGAAFEVC